LTIFEAKTTPQFAFINQKLNNSLNLSQDSKENIRDIFFYKGETYIKDIVYGVINNGFFYMSIKKLNNKQELAHLCLIAAKKKNGEKNAK
jgi:hypothetical protein